MRKADRWILQRVYVLWEKEPGAKQIRMVAKTDPSLAERLNVELEKAKATPDPETRTTRIENVRAKIIEAVMTDLTLPYSATIQAAFRAGILGAWREGQDYARSVVDKAYGQQMGAREKDVLTVIREVNADSDRFTRISSEYESWAANLGDKTWEKKISSVRDTLSSGTKEGWPRRNQYAYVDKTGARVSAFEATGGRGGAKVSPGFKRELAAPGVMDVLGKDLQNHRTYELDRIVRTEGTRAYNSGMKGIYEEDKAIVGYEFMAIIDSRTTDVCLMLDGVTMSKDDPRVWELTPPLHVSCRSTLLPIFVFDEHIAFNVDMPRTRVLEDRRGNKTKLTYTPARVRPMETGGQLNRAGFGRENLLTHTESDLRRAGFISPTPAENVGEFLHPGSRARAARSGARTMVPQDLPESRKAAEAWARGELQNAAALKQYEPALQDIDTYIKAMGFETKAGLEYLKFSGRTRTEIYDGIAEARAKVLAARPSREKWLVGKTRPRYVAERRTLHQSIVDDFISGGRVAAEGEQAELLMTGGFPGAGKSSMLKNPAYKGWETKYVHVDSDEIKKVLARADGIQNLTWQAASYQLEADDIIEQIYARAIRDNKHILFDGTLKSTKKVEKMIRRFQRKKYYIEVAYADLPLDQTMVRAVGRFMDNGRFVDPVYIATHDKKNVATLDAIKNKVNKWRHWNTDVPRGQLAQLVGEGGKAVRIGRIVREAEGTIVGKTIEHCRAFDARGRVLLKKSGSDRAITFSDAEMAKVEGASVFTHNHPTGLGNSFSKDDVTFAIDRQIREMRAVGKGYLYTLRVSAPATMTSEQAATEVILAYEKKSRELKRIWRARLAAGQMTLEEANLIHGHKCWKSVARKSKWFKYSRVTRRK